MKNKKENSINAFSLTEILVTMFIIMLVIIASAPMITKKNAKNKNPHGIWECYLDENGKHVSKTTINGVEQTALGTVNEEYCLFEPQTNAKNYTVLTIGGGGGGASGTSFSIDKTSYGTPVGYTIPADGNYDILVVGGGGGGSAYIGGKGNKGGAAGGVVTKTEKFNKGTYCILAAGMGGIEGGSPSLEESASSGEADPATCTSANPNAAWKEICNGKDGDTSRFYSKSANILIEATGGKGGTYTGIAQPGTEICGTSARPSSSTGGKLFLGGNCTKANDFFGASGNLSASFGHGGDGSTTDLGYPGHNGIVMIVSAAHHSGGGGKRGSSSFTTINRITESVIVHVGQGGAGATTEDTNGEQGQNSSFGYYTTAKGGEGGTIRYKSTTENTGLAGEAGATSPYGGILAGGGRTVGALDGTNKMSENEGHAKAAENQYGAGGGGGGSVSKNTSTSSEKWGMGGRGMPGYVRVEWN